MNVRLWVSHLGSPVKLTLNEDTYLEYGYFKRTDEGYHACHTTLEIIENYVFKTHYIDARDCDGRVTEEDKYEVPIAGLDRTVDADSNPVYPKWKRVSARIRDYSAEAAGY